MAKKSEEKKRITFLVDHIDGLDDAYYNQHYQLKSDQEYDALKDELKTRSKTFQAKTKADSKLVDRITDALTRVGAPPPKGGWPKIKHDVPMGSLNKVNLPEELQQWFEDSDSPSDGLFIIEKMDGISIDLKYEDGVFVRGATRGDDETGQDITRNVKKMQGVPTKLKKKFTGHIRGEVVLCHADQKKHFPDMEAVRNAAGGIAVRLTGGGQEHLTVKS